MKPFVLALLLASSLCAPPARAGELVVRDAWIRSAPPGAAVLAGYATLENRGRVPIRLVGAESPAFARAELHSMRIEDGVMRMRPLAAIELAPGATVALAPGADHLMLREPRGAVARGDAIALDFVDDAGTRTRASFEVR